MCICIYIYIYMYIYIYIYIHRRGASRQASKAGLSASSGGPTIMSATYISRFPLETNIIVRLSSEMQTMQLKRQCMLL